MSEIRDINEYMQAIFDRGIEYEIKMVEMNTEALIEMLGLYYFRN